MTRGTLVRALPAAGLLTAAAAVSALPIGTAAQAAVAVPQEHTAEHTVSQQAVNPDTPLAIAAGVGALALGGGLVVATRRRKH